MSGPSFGSYTKTLYTIAAIAEIGEQILRARGAPRLPRSYAVEAAALRIVRRRWPRYVP